MASQAPRGELLPLHGVAALSAGGMAVPPLLSRRALLAATAGAAVAACSRPPAPPRAFTVCDKWFCSVLGPTYPNRHYLHSGTSLGRTSNEKSAFQAPSLWDRLDDVGASWGYYYGDLPFIALYPDVFARALEKRRAGTLDRFVADAAAGRLPA